ncbi:MAG: LacI family DNA-binding transcriptional regulator [Spirochaetes bacterium]|nr:LacI family DNA-binding transcriptional regulator [Spirochaetota bacterium]
MKRRAASINDIARIAKVSAMTVSRVLSDPSRVSEKTSARIMQAIQETGYRKDVYASINSRKRRDIHHRTICINCPFDYLVAAKDFPFFSIIYFSFMREIMNHGYRTVLTDIDRDTAQFVNAGHFDAVMLCGPVNAASYEFVTRSAGATPVLTVCAGPGASCSIDPDDAAGGVKAAEHFAAHGHTHVAVLTSEREPNHRDRYEHFKNKFLSLVPAGRVDRIDGELTREQSITDANIFSALSSYFSDVAAAAPTGFFVTNSYSAYLAYRFLQERGIRIPKDISFLGYDNVPFYDTAAVPLSRIWFDPVKVGTAAADMVVHMLAKPKIRRRTLIPVKFSDLGSVIDCTIHK